MTVTTQTYWDINGTPLNTYAYNISTLGGGRTNVPSLRGDDLSIPYRRGKRFTKKFADSRDITLAMWIRACDEDGEVPADGNFEAQLQENLDKLRTLMWNEETELSLTKRFWRDGEIVTATASAQFVRGLDPTMENPGLALTTVVFHLADPFFYGPEVEVALNSGSTSVTPGGDTFTTKITLDMASGGSVSNTTLNPDIGLSSDVPVNVDVFERTISGMSSSAMLSSTGGYPYLFSLLKTANTIVCDNSDVTMTYQPAYF